MGKMWKGSALKTWRREQSGLGREGSWEQGGVVEGGRRYTEVRKGCLEKVGRGRAGGHKMAWSKEALLRESFWEPAGLFQVS